MSLLKLKIKSTGNKKKIYLFGIPVCSIYHEEPTLESQLELKFNQLVYIVLPALRTHPQVFEKYKNLYQGKNVVLMATGPSCRHYLPMADAIHVGVNSAYLNDKVKLDYLFIQDCYPTFSNGQDAILAYPCKKFFGIHYLQAADEPYASIPQVANDANVERYYFLDYYPEHLAHYARINADITTRPLTTYGSVSFAALDFILWTNPKKVFLVGCDNSAVHFDGMTDKHKRNPANVIDVRSGGLIKGWKAFKEFAERHYPQTEIISVNPVGLKGLFKDIYTQEYRTAHPEINFQNAVMLGSNKN